MLSDRGPALVRSNVTLEGDSPWYGLDGRQIHSDDHTIGRHGLGGDLAPRSRSGAKIQQDLALFKETIFSIDLYEFKRSSRSISFLFGKLVPFV